ncbi:phorbol-12-myristate-13-acetate-induced protein 1 [Sphaerodactylus townsendi]|uniref:phorbol-12-myristate-13-acetate-induced protein 1 n=1 Tax=Sphaerodactylus townsendi TaxID=933632 RepID=UPI0020264710|nr:phorbol-12-myristate-13-acetate-induced protein 1 [Sphaerodactylus townsendi]
MAGKPLRRPSSAPAGTTDRRGHHARVALPATAEGAMSLLSSHSPTVVHDPGVEDQRFRTWAQLPSHSAKAGAERECALQLCKIGDKLNLRQKILNLIAKFFCPGTR